MFDFSPVWNRIWSARLAVGAVIKAIPIVGKLFFSPLKAHGDAITENLLGVIFSGLPVIFPLFAAAIIPDFSLAEYLRKLLGEGELFLYASAFVGPLIYAVAKERKSGRANGESSGFGVTLIFPYALWFITLSVLICGASAVAYALLRISPLGEHASNEQRHSVFIASVVAYGVAVLCLYSASVYRNVIEHAASAPDLMRRDERSFSDQWRQR